MKRFFLFPVFFWSMFASAFDWKTPIVVSHQEEPLEVRIEVTNLGPVTPTQLFPLLASESEFTARGIDRPEYLSGLTYAVDSSNGRVELVVRTATAWTQPELTTLVEVFTPNGPVLIPVSVGVGPKLVTESKVVQEPPKETIAVNAELSEDKATGKAPEITVAEPVETRLRTLLVRNGSTLWRLAKQVQPPQFTIEQVIMALYDENPQAFEYDNINALEKDKILNVPSRERLGRDSALTAKQRFDAHMKDPKNNFPRKESENSVAADTDGKVLEPTDEQQAAQVEQVEVSAVPLDASVAVKESVDAQESAVPTETVMGESNVDNTLVKSSGSQIPQTVTIVSPEVTELLEKITNLETKLDAMNAKVDAIAKDSKTVEVPSIVLPKAQPSLETERQVVETLSDIEIGDWIPSKRDIEAFVATELGKGTLIFSVITLGFLVGVRSFRRNAKGIVEVPQSEVNSIATTTLTNTIPKESQRSDESQDTAQTSEALELAIERLKLKIDDSSKQQEAQELYASGDEALIDAFSADTLNKNPEWGEDPDDEADVAAHQLELAQTYLDMGMTQTAIELLGRVSVSPDQASAEKARALLDAHRN